MKKAIIMYVAKMFQMCIKPATSKKQYILQAQTMEKSGLIR